MNKNRLRKLAIKIANQRTQVLLNGVDISNQTISVEVNAQGGEIPHIKLEIVPDTLLIYSDGSVEPEISVKKVLRY